VLTPDDFRNSGIGKVVAIEADEFTGEKGGIDRG